MDQIRPVTPGAPSSEAAPGVPDLAELLRLSSRGDEAAFAEVVRLAAGGEREDALMIACCLVRPDLAPALVHLAEQAGIRLGRAVAAPATLH